MKKTKKNEFLKASLGIFIFATIIAGTAVLMGGLDTIDISKVLFWL